MKKLDTSNPAFQTLTGALSPSAPEDPFTGSASLHQFDGKQTIASSGALLTQPALLLQKAASESGATTAVATQPAVASSAAVMVPVCAVPHLPGQGSGLSVESLSSLFPGMM